MTHPPHPDPDPLSLRGMQMENGAWGKVCQCDWTTTTLGLGTIRVEFEGSLSVRTPSLYGVVSVAMAMAMAIAKP